MKQKIGIILAEALLCASCGTQLALKNFKDLPKEISVETIGNNLPNHPRLYFSDKDFRPLDRLIEILRK